MQQASRPAISLSSGMIEQVPRAALQRPDVAAEAMRAQREDDDAPPGNTWPYNSLHNIRCVSHTREHVMRRASSACAIAGAST